MSEDIELPPEGFRTRGAAPERDASGADPPRREPRCNAKGVVGGPLGCGGLTELGRRQARALRDRLVRSRELDDASRALHLGAAARDPDRPDHRVRVCPTGSSAVADCDLCEMHPGEADGLTWQRDGRERSAVPTGTSTRVSRSRRAASRWLGFYERCRERAHGHRRAPPRRAGRARRARRGHRAGHEDLAGRRAPAARLRLLTENCSMTEIEFDGGRCRLLRYNDRAPLAARVALEELRHVKGHVEALGGVEARVADRGVVECRGRPRRGVNRRRGTR